MEEKVVDCDWGKNGEDEPALWDVWMVGEDENDSQQVPVGFFDNWDPETATNAVAGGNENDLEEVPVELFDDWDSEDDVRAGIVSTAQDQTSVPNHHQRKTKTPVPASGCKEALRDYMNEDEDDDKSSGGAVLGDQHTMSGEEKNEEKNLQEGKVVGLPRMKEVMSTVN